MHGLGGLAVGADGLSRLVLLDEVLVVSEVLHLVSVPDVRGKVDPPRCVLVGPGWLERGGSD